ncbi:MAG TPA: hypothetical protein VLX92_00505, partial [Kofleriaceae bacterium]|nr:hypothetical protein [Kofleriaceae bacterium]
MSQRFHVTDEFRAFMREVVARLDWIDDRASLLGPEAVQHACGHGGRLEGSDVYRFTYFAPDGHGRWELELREAQIREVAAGTLDELEGLERDPNTRTMRGEPLLVWGEYDEDALRVRTAGDLALALDGLHAMSGSEPCVVRMWSPAEEQVVAMFNAADIALYVVSGQHGYGTSIGDPTRAGTFELVDHHVGTIAIPWSHCLPWKIARPALIRFAEIGALGDDVLLDGTIPGQLLVLGDFDRAAELQSRRPPTADPALSSIPRKVPHAQWAKRLLAGLIELQLIELDTAILEAITARTTMLLLQHGEEAQESAERAQQLARELARVRGVGALFATGGDLQIALRRTQD